MLSKFKNWLNTNNNLLWFSIVALMVIGIAAMYFVAPYEITRMGKRALFDRYWQIVLMGFLLMLLCSRLSKKTLLMVSWIIGIFSFLLILMSVVSPHYIAGSSRYVFFFGIIIDPFAVMLPAYIVLMSKYLSDEKNNKRNVVFASFITLFIVVAAIMASYMFMAVIYLILFAIMMLKSHKINSNAFYTGMLVVFVMVLLSVLFTPHIQTRILNFGNYATQMSLNAITHSAFIGNTTQSLSALSRLPGSVSDFMFTSIIAKFGLLFGLLVLGLYWGIAMKLSNIIKTNPDKFAKNIAIGTFSLFSMCLIVSFAMAVGLMSMSSDWPFLGFSGTMYGVWCVLFGFTLATNKK